MNTMIKWFGTLVCLGIAVGSVAAEGLHEAEEYYKCGLYTPAKNALLKLLDDPANPAAEVCYYLGEVYFEEGKCDSAAYYYQKGEEADVTYVLNQVGKGKVALKEKPEEAAAIFNGVLSGRNKKNPELLIAIARAYATQSPAQAMDYIQRAKAVDDHYAGTYVLEGDMLATTGNKHGDACSKYEQAIYFDPACVEAYVKYARIYGTANPQTGIEMLQRILTKTPECMPARREMAEICYGHSRYKEAAEAYKACLNSGCCTPRELTRYATVLFYYGDFKQSLELTGQILDSDPENVVASRIKMYDLYALKEYEKGMAHAEQFFKQLKAEEVIGQDYLYYGRLLQAQKQYEQAIVSLKQALSVDSTHKEVNKEIAEDWEKLNQYDSAIVYYTTYIGQGGKEINTADYYQLGKCYYYASATVDSTEAGLTLRTARLQAADSIFALIATNRPDSYVGNFWRARACASLDPETEKGLAQPYYEGAAAILEKNAPGNARMLIECYSYLGYYYYLKNNPEQSKSYWNKILALDPENDVAKKALEGIK